MTDKFAEYCANEKNHNDFSQYVHENFNIIHTKMISEMRRKLGITADLTNPDGYVSLMVSLYGRMFNEVVYGLSGISQSTKTPVSEIIPIRTLDILICLLEGNNPLKGNVRTDVKRDKAAFQKMYIECIDKLREVKAGLPKD